jgi:hypothetical protein
VTGPPWGAVGEDVGALKAAGGAETVAGAAEAADAAMVAEVRAHGFLFSICHESAELDVLSTSLMCAAVTVC